MLRQLVKVGILIAGALRDHLPKSFVYAVAHELLIN